LARSLAVVAGHDGVAKIGVAPGYLIGFSDVCFRFIKQVESV